VGCSSFLLFVLEHVLVLDFSTTEHSAISVSIFDLAAIFFLLEYCFQKQICLVFLSHEEPCSGFPSAPIFLRAFFWCRLRGLRPGALIGLWGVRLRFRSYQPFSHLPLAGASRESPFSFGLSSGLVLRFRRCLSLSHDFFVVGAGLRFNSSVGPFYSLPSVRVSCLSSPARLSIGSSGSSSSSLFRINFFCCALGSWVYNSCSVVLCF
jgi:hypothetical protein